MRPQNGFTLIESLVMVSLALMTLTALLTTSVYTYRAFAGIGNYTQLNRQTRSAMAKITRDVRQAAALTSGSATNLSFTNLDGSLLKYQYDPSSQTLVYTNAGAGEGGTLLQCCISCQFSLFQFNPASGTCMLFTNATTASNCKVVELNWICRKTNLLSMNSEMMETARIVLRN